MNPGFAVVAAVLALLGFVCLWYFRKYRSEVALMATTQTSRAADIATTAPGTLVEVKGTIRCAAPLIGQFSGRPCVYAKSEVEREETRWRDGKSETHYVTESSQETHALFDVEDDSGRARVNCAGATVEALNVYNQSGNSTAENLVSLASSLAGSGSWNRRFKEHILAPDSPVYVLGTVMAGGTIGAAPQGAAITDFLVTYKSEEERMRSSRITEIILVVVAALLFAAAAASIYAAVKYRIV